MLVRLIALLAFLLLRTRRQIVRENLARAFPDLSPKTLRLLIRTFARNLADVVAETIKAYGLSREELLKRVTITNIEVLDRFVQAHQSIVLLGSHEANWEWVFLACSGQLPFDILAVYGPLPNAHADAFMNITRSRFGASLCTRQDLGRQLIEGRKKLRAVVLTVDGKPLADDECHWVTFLNQDTAFRSRFEALARQWQYPVVFTSRKRTARGHYAVTFEILGEPPYGTQHLQLVAHYAESLQRSIRANPADWLWTQRRWNVRKPLYH
jgi:KDO2-lipid IV(A) lauroyltransferase